MKILTIKTIKPKSFALIIIAILMASTMFLAMSVPVQAVTNLQPSGGVLNIPSGVTPDYTLTEVPYLSVSPSPVGLGQAVLVNMWQVPAFQQTRYMSGYKVTITKPDGTTDSVTTDSYYGDLSAYFNYVVDQVGNWSFQFSYPGGYYAAGNYSSPQNRRAANFNPLTNDTIVSSYPYSIYVNPAQTAVTKITVQQDLVASWPPAPLPTDYWTRPVEVQNREWWTILGMNPWYGPGYGPNFPANTNHYAGAYGFLPYVQAPTSAHIVWTRMGAISGIVGSLDQSAPTALSWVAGSGIPSIFFAGYCYQTVNKPITTLVNGTTQLVPTNVFECYDIRTGAVKWDITGINTPTMLEYSPGEGDVPGATAIRFQNVYLMYIGNGRLIKYDPYTGATALNVSIAPITTGQVFQNGWALTVQDLGAAAGSQRYRLLNWTTIGTSTTLANRIQTNTTYARSSLPSSVDYEAGYGATYVSAANPGTTAPYKSTNVTGYRLSTGEVVWTTEYPEATYSGSQADHGMIAVHFRNGYFVAWDLATGRQVWKSDVQAYPWSQASFGNYGSQSGYGLLYAEEYDGIYAINWTTGHTQWKYEAPATPFETPYIDENGNQVYSWDSSGTVADGMFFVQNSEHSPSQPLTRGWRLHAINVTNGECVWNITGEMDVGAIGDGYLTASNSYDGIMYVFGKGQSATTVTAPQTAVSIGASVLIQGTVTDKSPATTTSAKYAPGQPVPCVSDASMTTQMEYLYMQYPIGGIWGNATITGIPVILTAIGSDGAIYNIGTVTSNGYYGTFAYAWAPPKADTYTITATFAGDDSYGSSSAATGLSVSATPAATSTPTSTTAPSNLATTSDLMLYIVGVGIAIIIAVAIVGALILRKHA